MRRCGFLAGTPGAGTPGRTERSNAGIWSPPGYAIAADGCQRADEPPLRVRRPPFLRIGTPGQCGNGPALAAPGQNLPRDPEIEREHPRSCEDAVPNAPPE